MTDTQDLFASFLEQLSKERETALALLLPLKEMYPHGNGLYEVECKELYMIFEGTPDEHPARGMQILESTTWRTTSRTEFDSFNKPGFCCILKIEDGYWVKINTLPTFPLCALVRG